MSSLSEKIIKTKAQFKSLIGGVLRKRQISIGSLEIGMHKKKFTASYEVTRTPVSRIYIANNAITSLMIRSLKSIITAKDFTFDFLSVTLKGKAAKHAKKLFGGTIYVVYKKNGWVKFYSDQGSKGKTFIDLEGGHYVAKNVVFDGDVHIYKCLAWTASNKRQQALVFMDISKGDNRFKVLNTATLGAFEILMNKYGLKGGIKTFMALQKAGGYIGNVLTGSVNFGVVKNYARAHFDWTCSTNEFFLTEEYQNARKALKDAIVAGNLEAQEAAKAHMEAIKNAKTLLIDADVQDGQMYINVRVFAELFLKRFGLHVDPRALVGLLFQARPTTAKASALGMDEDVFNQIVDVTCHMAGTKLRLVKAIISKKLASGEYTQEEATKKIQEAEAEYKVTFIGDRNNLLFIGDKHCFKLDYDMSKTVTFEILAMSKCSTSRTSKQFAETILYAAQQLGIDGAKLLQNIMELSITANLKSKIFERKAHIPTPEEVEDSQRSGFFNDLIAAISPEFIMQNKALFNSVVRQSINSDVNAIDGLNGSIISHNRRLVSDFTFLITNCKLHGILKTGEVFINSRKISKVVMIKYPKMGLREFYFAKNVSLKEIKNRIDFAVKKHIITKHEGALLYKAFKNIDNYLAVLPARMTTACACAGLDYDYDGSLFVEYTSNPAEDDITAKLTNELIEILEQTKMKAVVIL